LCKIQRELSTLFRFSPYYRPPLIDGALYPLFLLQELHQLNLLFQLFFGGWWFFSSNPWGKLRKSEPCQACTIPTSLLLELLLLRLGAIQTWTGGLVFFFFLVMFLRSKLEKDTILDSRWNTLWIWPCLFDLPWMNLCVLDSQKQRVVLVFAVSTYQSCWQNIRSLDPSCKRFPYAAAS